MNIWTITDSDGGLHGPWVDLIGVNKYIAEVKPPEPLILTQTLNGTLGMAAEIITKALLAGVEAIRKEAANVEGAHPQG